MDSDSNTIVNGKLTIQDQALTVSDTNFILSNMRIIMDDRFGFPINNGNLEYSFTLAIEYE